MMRAIENFPREKRSTIDYLLTDIDDTLTNDGRLPACAFTALEDLEKAGIKVIPITGRPAGWCDHIARMWPVHAIVGENGAFYFVYDRDEKKMIRRYCKTASHRKLDQEKLDDIKLKILKDIPGCVVSADQPYREADLAIDFTEDVNCLPQKDIDRIVSIFEEHGATAKISSIHVNGWFGNYDKLSMTKTLFKEVFEIDLDTIKNQVVYIGDSPNDEPMFEYFPLSFGVANLVHFKDRLAFKPAWITKGEGGIGFAEMAKLLLT